MVDRESIYGTETEYDEPVNPKMGALATKVAKALYEGDWRTELVTREIATAEDRTQAVQRLQTLALEVERATEIVKRSRK